MAWFATAEAAGIVLYLPTLALTEADMFDATAGHVVHVARQRGWPALSADPGRLRRVHPSIEIDLI